jgi:lysophospholipase L1-like esterase
MLKGDRILFIGDSLIAFHDWPTSFTEYDCVNLGVPGETVAGWLPLAAQASVRYPEAECLVVMLGANNLCQQDYSFFPDYQLLLDELQRLYPQAQVVVCSLLPHQLSWLGTSAIPRLNESLQAMVDGLGAVYLDLHAPFVTESQSCFMEDGVHLSKMGYNIWCDVLETFLERVTQKDV